MSYMNHDAFAQGGIQELNFNETEQVSGSILFPAIALGVIVLVAIGWERAHQNAERAE